MNELGMFAKFWQPGRVKTRLARAIGDAAAARLHQACVSTLVGRFGQLADRRVVCFTPSEQETAFAALVGSRWQLKPQCAGDLGQRMRHYFSGALVASADRVVLIGSDSPTLPDGYIDEAFDHLSDVPVVLGPSDDGGYYLIGASGEVPEIFEGIAWGTSVVYSETMSRLRVAGHAFHELPRWYDIDTVDDLVRLRRELNESLAVDPRFQPLRESINALSIT